ncbi:MAG: hypothetical protein RL682_2226, partial [Pseudomonadota bacterium]
MLEVRNLNVWYGSAQALFDVSLHVQAGELVVLQGLNGAGKSTLLQAIMGLSARAEGVISYQNKSNKSPNILGLEPHAIARLGLGYVPEDRRLFTALTVAENLHIAARQGVHSNLTQGDKKETLAQRQERVLSLFPA